MTFVASANAVIMTGAKPVFCDIYNDTLCIDIDWAEKLVTKNTKAIMPVHLYGQSADMVKIKNFAINHNIFIIEDAAQGVGVKYLDKHVGTFGDCGILSYYGNKTITCGEGGVLLTDNDILAKECYRLKNHGRDNKGSFIHNHIGFNFSFTEMQAAIGIAQMNKLNRIINKKKIINDLYLKELSGIPELTPIKIDKNCKPVYWFTSFLTKQNDALAKYLLDKSIQTRKFFYPLHKQPCYIKNNLVKSNKCKTSELVFNMGISLPSSYHLTNELQKKVMAEIKNYFS
jgi:perosamine synthetase